VTEIYEGTSEIQRVVISGLAQLRRDCQKNEKAILRIAFCALSGPCPFSGGTSRTCCSVDQNVFGFFGSRFVHFKRHDDDLVARAHVVRRRPLMQIIPEFLLALIT